ncbi:MAG: hypothetical protein KGD73_13660 [Candidatus Lokiarchaeota archaeon]|nr:hypothetical protein [Candidatus Lokiarchaeota archaeon]
MISSDFGNEVALDLRSLFEDQNFNSEIKTQIENLQSKNIADNLTLMNEIQAILRECSHLNPEQRLMYCASQRYFMKLYLRKVNKQG